MLVQSVCRARCLPFLYGCDLDLSFLNWLAVAELHETALLRSEDGQGYPAELEGPDHESRRQNQGRRKP